jgi:hypothetical protein
MDIFTRFSIETSALELRPVLNRDALPFSRMFNACGGDFQTYSLDRSPEEIVEFGPSLAKYSMQHLNKYDEQVGAASLYVVRKQQGRPFIGRIRLWQDDQDRLLISPYLIGNERRQNVLTNLYEQIVGRAYVAGLFPEHKMFAEAALDNEAGQRFLLSHEFKVCGEAYPLKKADDRDNSVMVIPFERELPVLRHYP